jgi:protoporphyrinogen IX oxidase
MPLLKLLHLAALIGWCGMLLYLPSLIAAASRGESASMSTHYARLARELFIAVATPAALVTIATGTALFAGDVRLAGWLVAKLTAVAGMVLCHAACGALILRVEHHLELAAPPVRTGPSVIAGLAAAALTGAALWLVLARP